MPDSVGANSRTVVHKSSNGITIAFPDVCLTPAPPAPPIPIPYPNIALSSDSDKGAKKVKVKGKPLLHKNSNFSTSTGDEPGTSKGIVSAKTKGKAEFVSFSFDVKVEGKGVVRAFDLMLHNNKNTPPFPLIQAPLLVIPPLPPPPVTPLEWKPIKIEVL